MAISYNFTARQMDQILRKNGYSLIRVKGSHQIYKNGEKMAVVPIHLKKSIVVSIVKSCQLIL